MRVVLLSPDDRERFKRYDDERPIIPTPQAALLSGWQGVPDLEIHYLSCLQQPVRSPAKLADNIWYHSLHVPKIGWMRTFYQGCVRAVRKKLRDLQPDIVHGQGSEREAAIGAVLSGLPNLITIHGNMKAMAEFYRAPVGTFYWLASKLETFALRRTSGVLCNSAYTESIVAPRAKRTWRVPNAVRLPFFSSLPAPPRNPRPVMLCVGTLAPYKRQLEILEMARNLWNRKLDFEMRFIGDTYPGVAYNQQFFHQLGRAESDGFARHLGMLDASSLVAALDAADALVHFPTEEAFGLVVAEALARNLKLFAASTGGIPDIASDVEGTELFPTNDFTALENSIARWIASGCPRPTTAANKMCQRYSPEIVARRHLEVYREVLNNPS